MTIARTAQTNSLCLLVIDLQHGIDEFENPTDWTRSTLRLELNVASLLSAFRSSREHDCAIIHVRHTSNDLKNDFHRSKVGFGPLPCAVEKPGETIVVKHTSSAFVAHTKLEPLLRAKHIRHLVVVGMSSAHCVSSTVRSISDAKIVEQLEGVNESCRLPDHMTIVSDATALYWESKDPRLAQEAHQYTLDLLDGEFCNIKSTEEILTLLKA